MKENAATSDPHDAAPIPLFDYTSTRRVVDKAQACIQRCDHGAGKPLTLDECEEAVEHPLNGASAADLKQIVAYLAAQVVGYQHRADQNAALAVTQIEGIVRDYRERTR